MNSVTICGNLTRDPESAEFGGKTKVTFSVADPDPFDKDEERAKSFYDVEFWGKSAEAFARFHQKGDKVLIFGRLNQDRWEKDGVKRSKVYIKAENFEFVKARKGEAEKATVTDEEVPF